MTADLDPLIERLRKLSNGGPFSLITAAAAALEALREERAQLWDDLNESQVTADKLRAERDAAALKADNADGMAGCMVMLRDDLIRLGVVSENVAPMFMTEAIVAFVTKERAERDAAREALEECESVLRRVGCDVTADVARALLREFDASLAAPSHEQASKALPVAHLYIGIGAYTRGRTIARTPDELGGEIDLYPNSWKRVAALYAAPPAAPEGMYTREQMIAFSAWAHKALLGFGDTHNEVSIEAWLAAAPTPGERG